MLHVPIAPDTIEFDAVDPYKVVYKMKQGTFFIASESVFKIFLVIFFKSSAVLIPTISSGLPVKRSW